MNTIDSQEWTEGLDRVENWPASSRIALAKRMLDSLEPPRPSRERQQVRLVHEMIGSGAGAGPPPDDETVKQWIDDHRVEKYG